MSPSSSPMVLTLIKTLREWQLGFGILFIVIFWNVPAESRDEPFTSLVLGLVIGLVLISSLCLVCNLLIGDSILPDGMLTLIWLVLMMLIML